MEQIRPDLRRYSDKPISSTVDRPPSRRGAPEKKDLVEEGMSSHFLDFQPALVPLSPSIGSPEIEPTTAVWVQLVAAVTALQFCCGGALFATTRCTRRSPRSHRGCIPFTLLTTLCLTFDQIHAGAGHTPTLHTCPSSLRTSVCLLCRSLDMFFKVVRFNENAYCRV